MTWQRVQISGGSNGRGHFGDTVERGNVIDAAKIYMAGLLGSGKTVSVEQARKLLKDGYTYLDVRTPEEYSSGHVEGAVNIPFKIKSSAGMTKNDKFGDQVLAKFNTDAKLVLACQGGMRSSCAVKELKALGFTRLEDMGAGFGGWTRSGFPTTK